MKRMYQFDFIWTSSLFLPWSIIKLSSPRNSIKASLFVWHLSNFGKFHTFLYCKTIELLLWVSLTAWFVVSRLLLPAKRQTKVSHLQRNMLKNARKKRPGSIKHCNKSILAVKKTVALNSKEALQQCQDLEKKNQRHDGIHCMGVSESNAWKKGRENNDKILCSCSSICKSGPAWKSNFSSTAVEGVVPCETRKGVCLRWLSLAISISEDLQSNGITSVDT